MEINFVFIKPNEDNYTRKKIQFEEENMYEVMAEELDIPVENITMDVMPAPMHSVVSFTYFGKVEDRFTTEDINFMMFGGLPCFGTTAFAYLDFDENNEANLISMDDELAKAVFEFIKTNRENIDSKLKETIKENIESGEFDRKMQLLMEIDNRDNGDE
ncbi:hypothetical protein PALS2_006 [Staphylococcus phage PALS_2]|nr:hypothetical protein PALS2_006 [Staphylococcus phage PALS_2]BDE75675.1 hypothetical protein [Staphylococcus phage S6]